jgi:hypothetical protein
VSVFLFIVLLGVWFCGFVVVECRCPTWVRLGYVGAYFLVLVFAAVPFLRGRYYNLRALRDCVEAVYAAVQSDSSSGIECAIGHYLVEQWTHESLPDAVWRLRAALLSCPQDVMLEEGQLQITNELSPQTETD